MHRTSAGAGLLWRLLAAATTAIFLGSVIAPGLVLAAYTPPIIPDVYVTTPEDIPAAGNLLPSFDPEAPLTVVSHGQFNAGLGSVLVSNATGGFTFTPTANASGTGSISFGVSDGETTVFATLYVTVTPVNDPPVCTSPVSAGDEDTQQTGTLSCTDVEATPLTLALVSGASHGTAAVQSNGAWTYDPNPNYNGPDSFTFRAYDGAAYSATATVHLTITAVNDPPVCADVPTSGAEDTVQSGTFACTDVDLDVLSYSKESDPAHGVAAVGSNGDWTFTPDANYFGTDSFTYRASDGTVPSSTKTVTVTISAVNDVPVCPSDGAVVAEDHQAAGSETCTDVEGSPLTYAKATNPAHGTAAMLADGTWTYDPAPDYNGPDSFTYRANDGTGNSAPATVSITVTPVNDNPVATDGVVTVVEDTPTDVTSDVLALATDVDGDSLAVTAVANAAGGTADLTLGVVTFTPGANACGAAEGGFDYTVADGHGGVDTAHATVDVTCVNDAPVATGETVTVVEDTPLNVTNAILTNDSDVDHDTLVVSSVSNATGGGATLVAGVVTFSPTPDLCGLGAGGFDYVVSDGHSGTDSAHATVNITCVNDDPVVPAMHFNGTEDTALPISDAALLADVSDVDGGAPSVDSVSGATGGVVAHDAGVTTFTPDANLCGTASGGFDYTVSDGAGGSATGHVTLDLACVEDAPVAVPDSGTAAENQGAKAFDVLANDSDVDAGDTVSLVSASVDPSMGTASVSAGKVWYTPAHLFTGDAAITYTITDGTLQAVGTLTVSVAADLTPPVVAAPTVAFGTGRVDETAPLVMSWSATDANGIAAYQVQVSVAGGAFASVYTGTGTSITKLYAFNKSLVWRVRAQDGANNWSGWVTSATHKLLAYQTPGSSFFTATGSWTNVSSSASSGTGYRYVSVFGKYAQLKFTGMGVLYVAPKLKAGGYVKVYVDGAYLGRFTTYRASTALGQIIAKKAWATSGAHTIKIVDAQSGRHIALDAFIVLR